MMSPAGEYILSIWYSCLSFHICTYLFFISSYHHLHVECVYFCNTHISSIDCHCHQHINNTCHPSILSPNIVDLNSFGFGSLLKVHLSKISAIWFLILYIWHLLWNIVLQIQVGADYQTPSRFPRRHLWPKSFLPFRSFLGGLTEPSSVFSLQSGVIEVWISPPKQSLHGPWLLSCRHKYLRVWALKTTFYPLQSCSCFLTLLSTRAMWIFMFVLELNMFTHTLSCKWRISSTLV